MEFTGERYVPGVTPSGQLYVEHMSRYLLASEFAKDRCILDIGCGCGYGSHWLALQGAELVLGIDKAEEAIEFAVSNYVHPSLHFAVMDAYSLALDRFFDLVTCFEVIEHVENPAILLREIRQAVDDAGLVLISTPNKATYRAEGSGKNPFHFKEYDQEEFDSIVRDFFPHVIMLGQFWAEAMLIATRSSVSNEGLGIHFLPERYGLPGDKTYALPSYLLAVCSKSRIGDELVGKLSTVAVDRLNLRFNETKCFLGKLTNELNERSRWAKRLDQEVASRDETIRSLQKELEDLRDEFDKRGRWALSLEKRIRELEALISNMNPIGAVSTSFYYRPKKEK